MFLKDFAGSESCVGSWYYPNVLLRLVLPRQYNLLYLCIPVIELYKKGILFPKMEKLFSLFYNPFYRYFHFIVFYYILFHWVDSRNFRIKYFSLWPILWESGISVKMEEFYSSNKLSKIKPNKSKQSLVKLMIIFRILFINRNRQLAFQNFSNI